MNKTKIRWTKKQIAKQEQRNLQRDEAVKKARSVARKLAEKSVYRKGSVVPRKYTPGTQSPTKPGLVYLIHGDGLYKIGLTKNLDHRLPQIYAKYRMRKYGVVCTIKTENMLLTERTLHEMFADKRVFDEWFNLDPGDVRFIKSVAGPQEGFS